MLHMKGRFSLLDTRLTFTAALVGAVCFLSGCSHAMTNTTTQPASVQTPPPAYFVPANQVTPAQEAEFRKLNSQQQ